MADRPARPATRLVGLAAFALPLALYWRTAAPTVYGVDSAELTTGAALLGIVHPPGAPAYLLVGHVFSLLPIGDVGYRINLLSVLSAAAAVYLLFCIVRRLTGDAWLALLTGWVVACSYYLWITAVAAELYAPAGCLAMAVIALALRWRAAPTPQGFARLWLLAGVGLGVHLSSILLLPGLAVLAGGPPPRPWRNPVLVVIAALAGLAGAAVYLYLPLRHLAALPLNPARDSWQIDLASWNGFWWMLSGGGFRREFFAVAPADLPLETARVARLVWSNYLGIGALLAGIGAVAGLRRQPWIHLGLALMAAGHLAFFVPYGAPDKAIMFLPVLLIVGVWLGVGAAAVGERFGTDGRSIARVTLVSLAALLLALNFRFVDVSADRSARQRGEAILGALAPRALFVGAWGDVRLVEYLQYVEGQRPDVQATDTFFSTTAERWRRIRAGLDAGRPVYVSTCRDLDPSVRCEYQPACSCHLLRAAGAPAAP